jgi:hypothetical protein
MHGLANQLEVEILLLMRQEEEDLLTTFARLSWNNTQRDLEAGIEDRIAGEVGLRVAQLSGPALESYRERWGILAARLGEHIKDREQRFCRGVDDLKNDVLQQLTARLVLLDFASAETALRGGLRRFDALEGVPATSALPASLADYLAKAKAATAAAGEEQIDTREGEIVASFEAALEEDLPEVSETLQSGDPQAAMARLDALVDNLRRSFPERSFREAANPWRIASGRIERLRNQITLALQRSRATEWSKTLQHAYEIVLSGDLATAKTELQYRAKGLDPARAEPHLRLLDHALAVRRQLLTRLLRTAPKRRVKDIRMRGGGEVHVEVVRRGEGVSLQIPDQTDRNSTIPLAMLRVRDLVARAPDFTAELDADLRAGLALWFLLSGDTDVATLLAGGTFGALFREELIPLSESLSPPEQARLESYQTLVKLRDAVAQHDWATAQALLASLREDPQVAQTWEDELRDHARKIGTGIEEQDLHSRLRAAVLVGGEYKLLNRALTLTYDLRKTGFDPLPAGWQRDAERCIAYTERDARLGVAEALTFDSSCSIERALRVDLDLRLGVEAGAPRLFFLTLHGASVGLGLRGDGVVVGVPVARGLRATKELQEQIQKALRQSDDDPAFIVPGALHRLTVEARPQGGKVVVLTVSLDQREVFSGSVIRPSERDSGRVAVTALQPLTLQSLVVTGTVR